MTSRHTIRVLQAPSNGEVSRAAAMPPCAGTGGHRRLTTRKHEQPLADGENEVVDSGPSNKMIDASLQKSRPVPQSCARRRHFGKHYYGSQDLGLGLTEKSNNRAKLPRIAQDPPMRLEILEMPLTYD